ncbi:MAG: MBL fold metallo-hydrolase [Syntrophomonas sp.]
MKILIHRGSNEIGGTCIQLSTDKTTIFLDLGLPLSKTSKEISISNVKPDAVLISHPHQDHFGLIDILPSETPVYLGKLAKELLDATRIFLDKPLLTNNFNFFEKWQPFTIADFRMTPYLVDHSAVDAYGFLIEAEDKRLFYSGDFRGHGNKNELFNKMITDPPEDIDLLFMEGTMMERNNNDFPNERAVQNEIRNLISRQENVSFLISSSQNIDRLVSAHNACVAANKVFVIDFYTAWVLEKVKAVSPGIRAFNWDHVVVLTSGFKSGRQYSVMKKQRNRFGSFINNVFSHAIKEDIIKSNPSRYLILCKVKSAGRLIESYRGNKSVNVIYSQWLGYLSSPHEDYGVKTMAVYRRGDIQGIDFHYVHTSGHATVNDLQKFAAALKPKMLVPIHTEYGGKFNKFFDNVLVVDDDQALEI